MGAIEFALLVGLVGLAIGSFLNVCIDRLPRGQSIVSVPSHCEACGHKLGVTDLVPLVSYLWLRGRCRYCKASISIRLPLVELTTGLLFLYIAARYGATLQTPVLLTFVAALVVVFVIDLEHSLILNRITYPGIAIVLLVAPWGPIGDTLSVQEAYLQAGWGLLLGGGVLGPFTSWPGLWPTAALVWAMSSWGCCWAQCLGPSPRLSHSDCPLSLGV